MIPGNFSRRKNQYLQTTTPMFTLEQIGAAHAKVKSGADFPHYIQDLIRLGVTHYEAHVVDGHTDYFGTGGYKISSAARYEPLVINTQSDIEQFKADLKAHQQGKTGYPVFCSDSARSGVEKWTVSMDTMTCTYYDKAGNEMLVEAIPQ